MQIFTATELGKINYFPLICLYFSPNKSRFLIIIIFFLNGLYWLSKYPELGYFQINLIHTTRTFNTRLKNLSLWIILNFFFC